jgi:glycosyltransferase involved in cell wall biosynthesis
MFAPAERNWRDQGYRRLSRQATLVVLSSRNAQEDFEGFAYTERHKARVMPFVASVPETIRMQDPRDVTLRYRLPLDFIFLPNQFWRHKNHLAVFEALSILKTKGVKPYVVCSGNMSDVRNPTHVGEMIRQIAALGLRDQVAMLGLIPHDHVMLLARQAKCVLNPSLFEGWSTTVEEAKSIGKRVLLSNIRVHLEQDPPGALFFDPKNAEDLADKLHYVWTNWPSGPDAALEMEASNKLPDRMRSYAETFVSIATEAIEMVQGKK